MAEWSDEELLERLRNFSSDSPYETLLISEAVARIERLQLDLDLADFDLREAS